jgi:branched-chain amino acid transport system permease protein
MNFFLILITFACLYSVAGLSCAYLYRRLRLVSVGQAALLGTGAYTYAILQTQGEPFAINVFVTVCFSAIFGAVIVGMSERSVGEDYALLTFAIQMMWSGVIANWTQFTRGPLGISGLGAGLLLGSLDPLYLYSGLSVIAAGTALWLAQRHENGAFSGNAAVVARSSELASTIGVRPMWIRFQVGAVSGVLAGVAGLLLALFVTYVAPSSFGIDVGVTILAISFFALRGSLAKILLGSCLLVLVPELARFAGLQSSRSGYLQLLLAGGAVCLFARPSLRGYVES